MIKFCKKNARELEQHAQPQNKEISFTTKSDKGGENQQYHRKPRLHCTHCNISGHTIEKYYKLHGYPPGYKPKLRNQKQEFASFNKLSSTTQVQ